MISRTKNFIFVHIYKTAGTSVSEVLQTYSRPGLLPRLIARGRKTLGIGGKRLQNAGLAKHATAADYQLALGDEFGQYYRFSFVRNPFDWQVSLYHFIKQSPKNPYHNMVKTMSFDDYLYWTCREKLTLQLDFLVDDSGCSLVDYIGRVENLPEDFGHVCQVLGVQFALAHRNRSQHMPYVKYYSESTARLVSEAYAQDFERLGYSRDLNDKSISPISV